MNTRFLKWIGLTGLAVAAVAATTKISEYPATVTLSATDKFLIASGATNKHITWASLGALTSGTNMVQFTNGILTVNGSAIVNGGMTINGAASVTKATNAIHATNFWGTLNTSNFPPYEYITNGHTGAITISNDVTVVGTLTISSTNSTTTVSNLLVTGTISGAGTNDIFQAATNAAWTATQGATNSTVLAATSASNATNLYTVKQTWQVATNNGAPDFNVPYSEFGTNDAFAFTAPANVSSSVYQSCVIMVTNSLAAAKAITAPANCHVEGVAYVTNVSACSFFNAAGRYTNLIVFPLW